MLKLRELSAYQQTAILNHLSTHPDAIVNEEYMHDHVNVEVSFPENFFNDLHDEEIQDLSRKAEKDLASETDAMGKTHRLSGGGGEGAAHESPIRTLAWLHRTILDFYNYRWKKFQQRSGTTSSSSSFPSASSQQRADRPLADDVSFHLFHFISKRFGFGSMVKKHGMEILETVKIYREVDLDAQLFGVLLSSQCYDTVDVRFLLGCLNTLHPFAIIRQEHVNTHTTQHGANTKNTEAGMVATIQKSFLRVQHVPGLIRRCLDTETLFNVQYRVRHALGTWCNSLGQFPGLVSDPNFYAPPFSSSNPYVGQVERSKPPSQEMMHSLAMNEDKFKDFETVVETTQLLFLLLVNFKQDRLAPLRFTAPATGIGNIVYLSAARQRKKIEGSMLERAATPTASSLRKRKISPRRGTVVAFNSSATHKSVNSKREVVPRTSTPQPTPLGKKSINSVTPSPPAALKGKYHVASLNDTSPEFSYTDAARTVYVPKPEQDPRAASIGLDVLQELQPQLESDLSPLGGLHSFRNHILLHTDSALAALKDSNAFDQRNEVEDVSEMEKALFETVEKFGRFK